MGEYLCIQKDHNKWELIGKKHCGNGNDALYCSGTFEECTQFFDKHKKAYGGVLTIIKMRQNMTEKVVDDLAAELHRMTNARYAPTQESIKATLNAHLSPYLGKENDLCPRVWSQFYNFWEKVEDAGYNTSATEHTVLPIWMTSEYLMRRHPKFFLNSTMMSGPTSLVARKDGGKMAVAAGSKVFAGKDCRPKPNEFHSLLEDLQDTRAGSRIVGLDLTGFLNFVCDGFIVKAWNEIIDGGGMVYPYAPLILYSQQKDYFNGKIYLRSRYGVLEKADYSP